MFAAFFQVVGSLKLAEVNVPVAMLIWLMIVPMLLKMDFGAVREVKRHSRGIGVTLFINWAVKLFSIALPGWLLRVWLNQRLGVSHRVACPSALIGTSNLFELAVATAISLFGFESGAALATVVGVLIEIPVMLLVVRVVIRTRRWYELPAAAR